MTDIVQLLHALSETARPVCVCVCVWRGGVVGN